MKKILVVVPSFGCGGTNRSLQNLLNFLPKSKVEVDVFGMVNEGLFINSLINCNILCENFHISALSSHFSNVRGVKKIYSFILKLIRKITKGNLDNYIYRRAGKKLITDKNYDSVIAYSEGIATQFVACIEHRNKIAWIHCDYANYFIINHSKDESNTYALYKTIVCVSNYTASSFCSIYNKFSSKVISLYNVLDISMMKRLSAEPLYFKKKDTFNIVSVGRLDPVKRLSVIPIIAAQLKLMNCSFFWTIIGPNGIGDELKTLEANIHKYCVEDCVNWIGEQANPYNYIANADLLVCLSISEACPYVVNESIILSTPVVCTDFGSAQEFIQNGYNGIIAKIENFPREISSIILKHNLYEELKRGVIIFDYNNEKLIKTFLSLI